MGRVWTLAAVILPLVVVLREVIYPHDVFWQLAYGREIWASGAIPEVDRFSFTRAGEPFFDQPWLAQLVMYGAHALGGMRALVLLQMVFVGSAFALVTRAAVTPPVDEGAAARAALFCALPLAMNNLGIRPQSMALAPFALFVFVLLRRKWAWMLPLVMALWVNLHGSFVLGLALAGLHVLHERTARSALVFLATLAATLVNPRGFRVYGYVLGLVGHRAMARVEEWSGVSWLALGLALGAALLVGFARRRPPLVQLLGAAAFLAFGALAPRNAIWAGFVCAPVLAPLIRERLALDPEARSKPLGIACAVALVALPLLASIKEPTLGDTPVLAVCALGAPRRVATTEGAASYMMFAAPAQKTFVDTRIELFPPSLWDDWASLMRGEDARELTTKYGIDAILAQPRHARLRAWAEEAGWKRAHEDPEWTLYLAP